MNWSLIFWNALYTGINAAAAGYCLVAVGLNVHVGYTGLLNFGQAGFLLVGAYGFDKLLPLVRYYAYVQVADEDQNLWEEYTRVRDANPQFAMQKIVTPAQIFPVFRDLFKKAPAGTV